MQQLLGRWAKLFEVRDVVLRALEDARNAKLIGGALEAKVTIKAAPDIYPLLNDYRDQLRYIFIVSQVELVKLDEAQEGVRIEVARAAGEKCERCWNYSLRVGESERYPTACERCAEALRQIEEAG
ncbi:MAG: zinc finger domain-containing protein [Pyrinomonadaceae bacterium]